MLYNKHPNLYDEAIKRRSGYDILICDLDL